MLSDYYQAVQPLDPKRLSGHHADYDIELVAGDRECMTIPTAQLAFTLERPRDGGLLMSPTGLLGDGLHGWPAGVVHAINDGNTYVLANNNDFGKVIPTRPYQPDSSEILALNISTTDSDTIVFDTYNREVTLNGVKSIITTSSQYWRLVPGLTDFQYLGTVLILVWLSPRWYNGYTGVA